MFEVWNTGWRNGNQIDLGKFEIEDLHELVSRLAYNIESAKNLVAAGFLTINMAVSSNTFKYEQYITVGTASNGDIIVTSNY